MLTYIYTGDGQLYSIEDSKTGYKYTYTYDSIGRLIASSVRDGTGITFLQTRQEYNNLNQLVKQTWQVGSTVYTESYTYEAADGALNSYTNALGQSIDLTYDGLRRVEKVDTPLLDRTYTYLNVANSTTKTTGLVSSYAYKNSAGTALFTYGYTYDSVGNIATYNQNGTNWTYTYDAQNQLLSAASGSTTYSYSYDNVGNITSANGKSYTYGNSLWFDLLTKYDGQYILYEGQNLNGTSVEGTIKSGNPISYYNGTRWTFDWEEGRNLVSADSSSASVDYTYDQNGLRVSKTVDGVKHTYLYASGKLMRETISVSGSVTDTLDFFYDQNGYAYALKYNGTLYYYVTNLQGDVLHLTNTSGTTVVSYSYDPYGKLLNTTGSMATTLGAANPLRYRGYYYDTETGFYYLQSRYYDPAICRFINADSRYDDASKLIGYNLFAYCANNPVLHVDFNGYKAEDAIEEERYRFVGIGFQGELNVGGYEVGFEIIVYYDELVCGGNEPLVAVYLYEGAFVDNEDIMKSTKYLQTIEKLTLAITTNAIDEQNAEALLIALQAALFKDVGVSGSVVGIFGNNKFETTESYAGPFTTYSATINHVKVSVSTCSSCFSIAVGASTDKFGVSFGQSYYTQVY